MFWFRSMGVQYKIKFRDLLAFCFYHYSRSPFVIGIYGIILFLISIQIVQALPNNVNLIPKAILFFVTEMIAFIVIAALLTILMIFSLVSRRNKTLLTEHELTIQDNTFSVETKYERAEHRWFAVQKLARTRRHLFIYVSQRSAHVIPRRAFKDRDEWNSFCESFKKETLAV